MRVKNLFILIALILGVGIYFLAPASSASDPGSGDWPMWGGTPDRNMISNMKGLPTSWDVKSKKNVKWVAQLGSQTYGNVVVAGGMVFVGTNNEGRGDDRFQGDYSLLKALDEKTGEVIWTLTVPKLGAGKVADWEYLGI